MKATLTSRWAGAARLAAALGCARWDGLPMSTRSFRFTPTWSNAITQTVVGVLRAAAHAPQLIITIEFTAAIKLKSITVVGSVETDSNPADMKAFLNRDDVDFDNVEDLDAVQVCAAAAASALAAAAHLRCGTNLTC